MVMPPLRHPRSTTTKSMIKATGCDAASKQWYTLVKLDEYGAIGHVASDEELLQLEEELLQVEEATEETGCEFGSLSGEEEEEASVSEEQSLDDESEEDTPAASEDTSVQPLQPLQMPAYQKPGGPCDHCGAVDSPQWRRGPASKPMLCNACGTRYRRTNNLGPSTPMGRVNAAAVPSKKRSPPASPSSLNPAKKPRCAPSMGGLDRFSGGGVVRA